jgi:hypothetical protein
MGKSICMTLKEYLKDKNKEDFAAEVGVHVSAIYKYLNGRKPKHPIPLKIELATKGKVKAKSFNPY